MANPTSRKPFRGSSDGSGFCRLERWASAKDAPGLVTKMPVCFPFE